MDLRVRRTRSSIREAFIKLAQKKKIKRITIKELAEEAMINKATFYLHYSDLEALVSEIEDDVIADIVENIGQVDSFFRNVDVFFQKFMEAMIRNRKLLMILYENDRTVVIQNKLVISFREQILKENQHIEFTREMYIALTFFLRAVLDVSLYEEFKDTDQVFKAVSATVTVVTKHYLNEIMKERRRKRKLAKGKQEAKPHPH